MPEDITAATDELAGATATAETPEATGSTEQETQLAAIQASLTELRAKFDEESAARLIAEARAQDAENKSEVSKREVEKKDREYRGLMSSTTQKMQELKLLQQALANQEITDSKLAKMERLVTELASSSLEPERVQQINRDIDAEQQKRELEKYRAQAAAASQPQARSTMTKEYKTQLKNAYFKEFTNVSIDDLSEDEWYGNGASGPEDWKAAVEEIFKQKSQEKRNSERQPVDSKSIAAEIRTAMQDEMAAYREADLEKQKEAQAQIQLLQEELAESRRLSEEAIHRSSGRDRSGSPGPGTTHKLSTQLADIPESWLYGTPEQRKAYRDALNNPKLRDQIINQGRS